MASGDITHNGASSLGASVQLTIALISGGKVTINGSNDTYGVFWAEGNVRQNGSSMLGGSVVAGGDVDRNGKFNYTQVKGLSPNLNLPKGGPKVVQWAEKRAI